MATFNPQFFTNPLASLSTSFGIPTCMLNLGINALGLLSPDVLGSMAKAAKEGQAAARSAISGIVNGLFSDMGILDYDSGSGKLSLFSDSSKFGIDLSFMDSLAAVTGALSAVEDLIDQGEALANELKKCLEEFADFQKSTGPSPMTGTGGIGAGHDDQYTQNVRIAALGIARQQIEQAVVFANQCSTLITNIGLVLFEKQNATETEDEATDPIFRLVFGPPVSKNGLFILSEDGIYYDSQTRLYNGEPIPSASDIGFIVDSEKWMLDHYSNLGGKGNIVSVEQLNKYVDTIFDPNIIDDSALLTEYYDVDHLLNVLLGQKIKQVEVITKEVTELLNGGYEEESALVVNSRKSLNSITDAFFRKINKRKKQIEVTVKAGDLFGVSSTYRKGEIPVNDFSFLSSINLSVALDKQQNLSFGAGDVAGVVLPIKPLFVTNYGTHSKTLSGPLTVPPIGKGSIVFSPSVSSTTAPAISLTDSIENDGLFSLYNFLKPDVVSPGSVDYFSINCASPTTSGNAQLVADSAGGCFTSGVGIPYLGGIARWKPSNFRLTKTNNYVRLPPTPDLQNLFYNQGGCSIDCWLHVPGYGTSAVSKEISSDQAFRPWTAGAWGDYNYYKILLGNENTGGALATPDVSALYGAEGADTTRGLLIGFTRDPVIYHDAYVIPGSGTLPGENIPGITTANTCASSCFFIAPTQAFSQSAVEFVPDRACANSQERYSKLTIRDTYEVNGTKFNDVSGAFMHLHMSFDVSGNTCSVYLDGNLMTTSSISDVFGSLPGRAPRIPTFITPTDSSVSSFYYSASSVVQNTSQTSFDNGPKNDPYFTPWIVGGGWTDGIPINPITRDGGFMGTRHGLTSGLNGFVGSLKFYSRPLNSIEVLKNYNAQKGFFKNIST